MREESFGHSSRHPLVDRDYPQRSNFSKVWEYLVPEDSLWAKKY
jgi:hypothetical protein